MFVFEMRPRLKLSFLVNCLEMEAQAPTQKTTSKQGKKAWCLSLRGIFLFYSKIFLLIRSFSRQPSAKGALARDLLAAAMGKDDFCISCR
jgi:hypothetical protein